MVIAHHGNPILPQGLGRPAPHTLLPESRPPPPSQGSWRYNAPHTARLTYTLAILLSAGFHAVVFYGIGRHKQEVQVAAVDKLSVIRIEMPDLKDLEDPEPVNTDNSPPPDVELYRPTLMDAPSRIAVSSDFVQAINYASLVGPPDLNAAKVLVIPQNANAGKLAEGFGSIFNLIDLDRVPVPILQPSPIFPVALRSSVQGAEVVVEFIVDREGKVVNPFVVESSHPGFNDAAISGVARWRFRAGIKAGQKVNTRMSVPIVFRISDRDT
jgi:protein TonB